MVMDLKDKIDEIVAKVQGDEAFLAQFKEDPVKAVEGVTGADLPDEQVKGIIEGLKEKLALDKDGNGKIDIIENIGEKIGGLKLDKDGNGKIDIIENIGDKAGDIGSKIGGLFKKD